MAETATKHVRVSEKTYERLKRRKRAEESFDDVLERLLDDDRDLLAGFGAAAERDGKMADVHDATRRASADRIERFAAGRGDEE
ncbi:antitoxin VapB family protein [Halococcus sp. PRR34]|uniref:antitoxin VapB family protein n=1 Tax=Halococcus sp. PRR34 TaxID=3020830 RepID=UPI00236265CD|nr:antitoxin VapB family protein [Halococcus sp. PRR34]